METSILLYETPQIRAVIQSIRDELTKAIRKAVIKHAYDIDVHLSFGMIHINSKGSVSQISFNGTDVQDMDAFIVKQALHIGDDNYFDIKANIKENPEDFCFYPILIGGKCYNTILKASPFFERKYGAEIHYEDLQVDYVAKYLILYRSNWASPDVYAVGLYNPESTANLLLEDAGRRIGGTSQIYYCFTNTRPEHFLHLGKVKADFCAYNPKKNHKVYNFYKGSVISGIFKVNKKTDDNGKVVVKETVRTCLNKIIKLQYSSVDNFCDLHEIDPISFLTYLTKTGKGEAKYLNGDMLTPTRLYELLNLPFFPNADTLKDCNLLIRVEYDDIPS